ncbi:MAG: membrane-bound lytic murein transglycosylase MltF [Desulfobacteraceae bacterium]
MAIMGKARETAPRRKRIAGVIGGVVLLLVIAGGMLARSCDQETVLARIKKYGVITVLTRNNGHCYYNYQDKAMGFEYELARAFAEYLGVDLEIKTPAWQDLFEELRAGNGDFVAANITITQTRKEIVDFSTGYLKVQQHLVVHKKNRTLDSIEDLNGKTVHVRRGTSYHERLRELRDNGIDVRVRLYDDLPTEEFIRMVAEGEILATIADSNIAMLNRRYYPEVRLAFPVAEPQYLGWAVKKEAESLKKAIDSFFAEIMEEGTFARIHDRYYGNVQIFDYVDLRKYHQRLNTRLPRYEKVIKEAAGEHGFDWRLIAAMLYQESHMDPNAESYTGVRGIMQLTEVTAQEIGVEDRLDPEQAIRGGVRYLRMLHDRFENAQEPDRTYIALASYNVGYGHIRDAQKLAEEMDLNPDSWSALQEVLPMLRNPEIYQKTEHGYCRGTEPVKYVERIRTYYDILKRAAMLLT